MFFAPIISLSVDIVVLVECFLFLVQGAILGCCLQISDFNFHSNTVREHPLFNNFSLVGYAEETHLILLRGLTVDSMKSCQRNSCQCTNTVQIGLTELSIEDSVC